MIFIYIIVCVFAYFFYKKIKQLQQETESIRRILQQQTSENKLLKEEIKEIKQVIELSEKRKEEITPILSPLKVRETELTSAIIEEVILESVKSPISALISDEKPIVLNEPIFEKESVRHSDETSTKHPETLSVKEVKEDSVFVKFLKSTEKQFSDNWTGILGTAIMVLGIGYLSVYTALKVAPLFRVLILWIYAGLLISSYYLLKDKEKWAKTGLWLRSAGSSLFLFGCFGASQITVLSFINQNSYLGYLLISFGVGLNLYVGYIIKKQTFLSLHVVLSMLVLCVIPDKLLMTFMLAAVTSTIGILLSYKEKWEYHLLIVIGAFVIFDIWFTAEEVVLTTSKNNIAIAGIVMVFLSCLIMQYRNVYQNTYFIKSAFITHLVNWALFSVGLLLHATGSKFKTIILLLAAIASFFFALRAKNKNVFWLYHLDGMISFILLSLSMIMLSDWNVGVDVVAIVLYTLTLICLSVVYRQKEILLHKIFLAINHFFALGLFILSILLTSNVVADENITNVLVSLIGLCLITLCVPILSAVNGRYLELDPFIFKKSLSLNGIISIILSVFAFVSWNDTIGISFYYLIAVIAIAWCFLKKKYRSEIFDLGRLFFLTLSILVAFSLLGNQPKTHSDFIILVGLVSVVTYNWFVKTFYKNDYLIRLLGILGVNVSLYILSFKYLYEYEIVHVFSLLGLALFNYEFLYFHFKRQSLANYNQKLLLSIYYSLIITVTVIYVSQSLSFSILEMGLIVLCISVVETYALFTKRFEIKSEPNWLKYKLFNADFLIFNVITFCFTAIQIEYIPIYLSGTAVVSFLCYQKWNEFKNYNTYSFLILLGAIISTILISIDGSYKADKTIFYLAQTVSFILSVAYFYLKSRSVNEDHKDHIVLLPYLQNIWIIILLLIQVETDYLSLLFMLLGLVNFWLLTTKKFKINVNVILGIGLLAILCSVFYSVSALNNFKFTDWLLQLASFAFGVLLVLLLNKKEIVNAFKSNRQITLNIWLSIIIFTQLEHKWLPVYWSAVAIINLYLYYKKVTFEKKISVVYYLLANLHLGILSFNFYESKFLAVYLLIFGLLTTYVYLAYKWMDNFNLKNSLLIYPATLSIGCFLFLSFDKGILTFFWILEALGLLILGIILKEKYFRYVSLSLVGLCIIRLMFFDLSNTNFLIRALVLLGVGIVLLIMNSLFKKYKDRFDD